MNFIDKAIAVISPQRALDREVARTKLALLQSNKRSFEGAARGRRTDSWYTRGDDANAAARGKLGLLRDRHRDLVRNNPYANRAVSGISAHMVGYGITATPSGGSYQKKAWKAWAESTACDYSGRLNLYGIQQQVARAVVESGECLVRMRWRSASNSVGLQLQVLEADHLDANRDGQTCGSNAIIQGVEFNPSGQIVAYWLFEQHPGSAFGYGIHSSESKRVPADEVAHIYRIDRPGQVRGVPWGAPIILRLRDLDECEDAYLVRQKIAACFVGIIVETEAQAKASDGKPLIEAIEPGMLERLAPGQDIRFGNPPRTDGYRDYIGTVLHAVATGYGVPYELLTGDNSQVSFISGRLGRLEFGKNLDCWQWNMMIPMLCRRIETWWVQAAEIAGIPKNAEGWAWAPPPRALTDPTSEVPALIKSVRAGLQSMPDVLREQGYTDPFDVIKSIKDWNAAMDKDGVTLDSDPRRLSINGQSQNSTAAESSATQNQMAN